MGKTVKKSPERDINKSPRKDNSNDDADLFNDSLQNIIDLLIKLKKKKMEEENSDSLINYLNGSVNLRLRTYDDEDEKFKNYGEKIVKKKSSRSKKKNGSK